ncbi:PAS domain S-box protein [Caenispirillum bisanense]|uniref:histidine kinase n=1 Tax=Caenispirillum bisanense TaxID=414052 RepID=A0A286H314_9PROT|nr:PAS domain S-box protein [Caenispirillum bisanense]SOE01674.1 PAS domain S-box-containing protein [Caenispirillum bisanense]
MHSLDETPAWPAADGETAHVLRRRDWSDTPLGPLHDWPASLRLAVDVMLRAAWPVAVFWGPDLRVLYNDAWRRLMGERHPAAFGEPGGTVFADVWQTLGPAYGEVLATGRASEGRDQRLPLTGPETAEDRFFDFSLNPVIADDGRDVCGVMTVAFETTARVRAEQARREAEAAYREMAGVADLSADFRALFEASPTPFLVLSPDLQIVAVNDAYLRTTMTERSAIVGRPMFDVFPDNPGDPAVDGVRTLHASFRRVLDTRQPDALPTLRYDIRRPTADGGGFEPRWWQPLNTPVLAADGSVAAIIHRAADVTREHLAEARLMESEERFRRLADTAPVMIWVTDDSGWCTYLNRRWYEFTGQTIEDGEGFGWLDATHPADHEAAEVAFRDALAAHEGLRLEYRLRRADGTYRWVIDAAVPRFGADGSFLGHIGSVFDIDDRREAEERQALLAREVDHRARNALAVVQAVVRLTPADSPEAYREAIEGRIAALARAHGLLATARWTGGDLRRLAEDELAPYLDAAAERATLDGPAVTLAPDAVQPVAMILHELATNAVKHGALSGPTGRVAVAWHMGEDGDLRLTWEETGGPPVPGAPSRRGFGSGMIQRAARQLRGESAKDWRVGGVVCTVRIAASNLVRSTAAEGPATPAEASQADIEALQGLRILVAEDDALLAAATQRTLEQAGCTVVGPAGSLGEALWLAADAPDLDAAVLDVRLNGQEIWPAADLLVERGVPRLFTTGYVRDPRSRDAPVLQKPVAPERLVTRLAALVAEAQDAAARPTSRP